MLGAFKDKDTCVGFLEMGMQPFPIENVSLSTSEGLQAPTIGTIAVEKGNQRQGIAQMMMMNAEDVVKSWNARHQVKCKSLWNNAENNYNYVFDRIVCSVAESNTNAASLYVNKLGYERRGISNVRVRKDAIEELKSFLLLCKEI